MHAVTEVSFVHTKANAPVEVMAPGPWGSVYTGTAPPGCELGNYYHRKTRTYLFLLQGEARVIVKDVADASRRARRLGAGEGIAIEPGKAHVIRFMQDSTYILLKSSRGAELEADTIEYNVGSMATNARRREPVETGLSYFPL